MSEKDVVELVKVVNSLLNRGKGINCKFYVALGHSCSACPAVKIGCGTTDCLLQESAWPFDNPSLEPCFRPTLESRVDILEEKLRSGKEVTVHSRLNDLEEHLDATRKTLTGIYSDYGAIKRGIEKLSISHAETRGELERVKDRLNEAGRSPCR